MRIGDIVSAMGLAAGDRPPGQALQLLGRGRRRAAGNGLAFEHWVLLQFQNPM